MPAKDDCNQLLNAALPFAEQMLREHGEFLPFGAQMLPMERLSPSRQMMARITHDHRT
jgi:hypothetical protein